MPKLFIAVLDRATGTASGDEMTAIDAFNERLRAGGHWIMAAGLGSPDTATVIDAREGEPQVTSGPFQASEVYVSGFWVIDAPDQETALRLATEGSKACNRRVEVRPFL